MPNSHDQGSNRQKLGSQDQIVFFDGVCNLCNSSVSLLLQLDQKHHLKFSSLQSEVAISLLPREWTETSKDYESLVFWRKGQIFTRSQALIEISKELGWPWKFWAVLQILPKSILDFFYRLVARNRYRLFGKKDTCRLVRADEKHLFLEHLTDFQK